VQAQRQLDREGEVRGGHGPHDALATDVALAERGEEVAFRGDLGVLDMHVPAVRHREQGVIRGNDAAGRPGRPVRDGVGGVVVEAQVGVAELVEQGDAVGGGVDQVVAAISRILQADDHPQLFGVPHQRLDVAEETLAPGARRGVGVDDFRPEGGGKVHAALEDFDGVLPAEIDVRGKRVALQPAGGEPVDILPGLRRSEGGFVERPRVADDECRLHVLHPARRETVQDFGERVAVVRGGGYRNYAVSCHVMSWFYRMVSQGR